MICLASLVKKVHLIENSWITMMTNFIFKYILIWANFGSLPFHFCFKKKAQDLERIKVTCKMISLFKNDTVVKMTSLTSYCMFSCTTGCWTHEKE